MKAQKQNLRNLKLKKILAINKMKSKRKIKNKKIKKTIKALVIS
jgi:hypothetical protein